MFYALTDGKLFLEAFFPNDLPLTRTGKFTKRSILCMRKDAAILFTSGGEALNYKVTMHRDIMESRNRYEACMPNSTEKLIGFITSLKVVPYSNV